MADDLKAKEAVEWYSKNRVVYKPLAEKVKSIILEMLDSKNINYHSVTFRAKSIARYEEKASREKYKEPLSEIMDMAGIRIVTYTNSEASKVSEIVKKTFKIHPEHSLDKANELGVDRLGYRGIHYIGDLGEDRCKLPENEIFKGHVFEIQIRSILQHAWAEFEHDRNYKFAGVLPQEIQRRLFIAAGNLESVDREFDSLSKEVDEYTIDIRDSVEKGDLSENINSASLDAYMKRILQPLVKNEVVEPKLVQDDTIIEELRLMDIRTLKELDEIVPKDFGKRVKQVITKGKNTNFLGLLRMILIIHDADLYFGKAWRQSFGIIREFHRKILSKYGVDIKSYGEKYDFKLGKDVKKNSRKRTKS